MKFNIRRSRICLFFQSNNRIPRRRKNKWFLKLYIAVYDFVLIQLNAFVYLEILRTTGKNELQWWM